MEDIRYEFNVSLKIYSRFYRLERVCSVVTGYDNSSEKERGYSLEVDLGSTILTSIERVGVLHNLQTDLYSRCRRKLCRNFRRRSLRSTLFGLEDSISDFE